MTGWWRSIIWDVWFKTITLEEAEERGYHIERLDLHSKKRYAWTRDFKLGDQVYYLGHDGVGGWWHGNETTADEEMMRKKHNLHFYKKVSKIR